MRVPAVPGVCGPSVTIPAIGGFVPSRSPARSAGRGLAWFTARSRPVLAEEALGAGYAAVAAGGIVAVKGIGGYQLV